MLTMPTRKLSASSSSSRLDPHPYAQCIPALATTHRKDKAIAPPFRRHLDLPVIAYDFFDTDRFESSTGGITGRSMMIEIAIEKAQLASRKSGRRLGIGSEGSFGFHPNFGSLAANNEVIVLYDREFNTTIVEGITSVRTNFRHVDQEQFGEVESFLKEIGFPKHAVVVGLAEHWDSSVAIMGLTEYDLVNRSIAQLKSLCPGERIRIATDMRASFNPTRMAVIRAAATRLARRIAAVCPACSFPGFGVDSARFGVTRLTLEPASPEPEASLSECRHCKFRVRR